MIKVKSKGKDFSQLLGFGECNEWGVGNGELEALHDFRKLPTSHSPLPAIIKKTSQMISRILSYPPDKSGERLYHLSSSDITIGVYLPTLIGFLWTKAIENKASNFLPLLVCSEPKTSLGFSQSSFGTNVYVALQPTRFIPLPGCPNKACAFTAHFHPYPDTRPGRLFSATLSVS